jgi:acetyl-CoA carboxylase biotin carboxyl carrier protein
MENRERIVRSNGVWGFDARADTYARLSVTDLRDLIELMKFSDIEEITIEHEPGGLRLRLRKPAPVAVTAASLVSAAEIAQADEMEEQVVERPIERESRKVAVGEAAIEVRAPLVGIFRASMKRDGAPLVRKDDMVRPGQVVGAIEALNVLNEVEVGEAGRVQELLVEDGEPVEYGQPLLLIAPATVSS